MYAAARRDRAWIPEEQFRSWVAGIRADKEQQTRDEIERDEEARDPELRDRCRKYGLSVKEYRRMDAEQRGLCAVAGCGKPHTDIDHCHLTDAVRGLLCSSCNSALGFAKEQPATLRALADYLEVRQ